MAECVSRYPTQIHSATEEFSSREFARSSDVPAMMALPTPDPSSAWCVTIFLPFSPKMSTRAVCTRFAKLGYFCEGWCQHPFSCGALRSNTHIVQTSIGSYSTSLIEVSLLADDGRDTTRAKSCCSSANKYRQLPEELTFLQGGLDTEEVTEDADHRQKLICRVTAPSAAAPRTQHIPQLRYTSAHLSIRLKKAVSNA